MMDQRARATMAERKKHIHDAGRINFDPETQQFSGGGATIYRLVYGDLFDFGELLTEGGASLIKHAIATMAEPDEDDLSVLISLVSQAVAIGVLMERARWQR